jgi:hypothetical protein
MLFRTARILRASSMSAQDARCPEEAEVARKETQ